MTKMSEMRKEHAHIFFLITSSIFNGFSIWKKFWKAVTQGFSTISSNTVYIEDVEDRLSTPMGCNAMHVKDIEDCKNLML